MTVRPIRRRATRSSTPASVDGLLEMDNGGLDILFRASPAGEIPVGEMRGTVLFFPGSAVGRLVARVAYAVGWQGKVFDSESGDLKNRITALRITAIRALVSVSDSWVDGRPCVLLDYSRTSWLARMVRDEIRMVDDGLYLGVVWLRHRRVAWFALRAPANA